MLQNHFNALRLHGGRDSAGLSPATVQAARRYFAMAMDDAIREGVLMRNVARLTKPPKSERREIIVLTQDEIAKLIETAKASDHLFISVMLPELISLTVHTGLRQGEAFGLKLEDIDFSRSCLFVKRSLAHVVGQGAVFQETKTKTSRRRILLLAEDTANLTAYRKWQQEYAAMLGDRFTNHGLVFTSPFGEPISPTNFSRRYFKPLLAKAGIDLAFTFHGLRHTHATLLLQQGVNPKIVQERLGHSSIKMTMDTYSHVLPDMQQQAVEALEKLFP